MASKALDDVEDAVDAAEIEGMSTPLEILRQHGCIDAQE
jgi:hypothetical protein